MTDTCEYCGHPFTAHKEDSACECFVLGCDCTLGKAIAAVQARFDREKCVKKAVEP